MHGFETGDYLEPSGDGVLPYVPIPDGFDETAGLHRGTVPDANALADDQAEIVALHTEFARVELLEAGVLGHPDDVRFQLDAIAGGMDVGAQPVRLVEAPALADLAREGVLDVVDSKTQLDYLHGRIPEMCERFPQRAVVTEITDYGVCEVEYAALARQSEVALDDLLATMQARSQKQDYGYAMNSVHDGAYILDDGTLVPVRCDARVRFDKLYNLHDAYGNPAISVRILDMRRFSDDPTASKPKGVASMETGRVERTIRVCSQEVEVQPFRGVVADLVRAIRADAWPSALTAWAGSYRALPGPAKPLLQETGFTESMPSDLLRLLHHAQPESNEEAAKRLGSLFGPNVPHQWLVLTHISADELFAHCEEYGVTDRLLWLLRNAPAMGEAVVIAEREALNTQFRTAFSRHLAEAEQGINKVGELAQLLEAFSSHTRPRDQLLPIVPAISVDGTLRGMWW